MVVLNRNCLVGRGRYYLRNAGCLRGNGAAVGWQYGDTSHGLLCAKL